MFEALSELPWASTCCSIARWLGRSTIRLSSRQPFGTVRPIIPAATQLADTNRDTPAA